MCNNPSMDKVHGSLIQPSLISLRGRKLTTVSSMMERKKENGRKSEFLWDMNHDTQLYMLMLY